MDTKYINMAYINKKEFEKLVNYAPKGTSKRDIQTALIARGHLIQGVNDQEQKSFGGQLVKDIASPFVKGVNLLRTAAPVAGALASAIPASLGLGDKDKARQRIDSASEKAQERMKTPIKTALGTYTPATTFKEGVGVGLEALSTLYGGGAVKNIAQAGIKGAFKSAVKTGVKSGLVGGAGFGFGRGLGDDETVGKSLEQGAISGIAGAVGGGILGGAMFGGSLATKSLVKKVSQKLQPVAEQTKQKVTDYIGKAIRPKVAGLSSNQMKGLQRKQVEGFQVLKNNVKDIKLPDEYGGLTSRTPKTVGEVVSAVQDVKTKLFSRWDKLAREAGDKGASFNPIKTIGELTKITKDKSYSPTLRRYVNEILEEISELKGESPTVIQNRIKELNESLAGYFAGRVEKGKARIDASVAKLLNEELDDVIFNFTAGDYKTLRSQFSALKSIEKDATRTAQRMLNRQKKGLGDLTDIFTGGDLISGILTANPASVSRGLIGKGIQLAYKALNDPDRYIRKIFNELGETAQPQRLINRGLPTPSGKLSPTDAIPLPKAKGEILKSTNPKNFKTAEDYVKAQGTPVYRGEYSRKQNLDNAISTSLDKNVAKSFNEKGNINEMIVDKNAKIIDISDLRKQILGVEKLPNPSSLTQKQFESITGNNLIDYAKGKGYDVIDYSKAGIKSSGIKVGKLLDEQEYKIINQSIIKTKSVYKGK